MFASSLAELSQKIILWLRQCHRPAGPYYMSSPRGLKIMDHITNGARRSHPPPRRLRFFLHFDDGIISLFACVLLFLGSLLATIVLYFGLLERVARFGLCWLLINKGVLKIPDERRLRALARHIPDGPEQDHRQMCRKYG